MRRSAGCWKFIAEHNRDAPYPHTAHLRVKDRYSRLIKVIRTLRTDMKGAHKA